MISYWILGAGRFGRRAAEKLRSKFPGADITLVDRDSQRCESISKRGFNVVRSDAVAYLEDNLTDANHPDWIIPAVPLHVAYAFVQCKLQSEGLISKIPVPDRVISRLPNPIRGEGQTVFASNADFLCPEDCPEPADVCTYTGKPRPCTLYRELVQAGDAAFCTVVIRSRQLLPGVGGYRPGDLLDAMEIIRSAGKPIVLSTACRCHGVVDAFRLVRNLLSFQ